MFVTCANILKKINKGPINRSSEVLELIHSDTWGKCRVPGVFGSSYFVSFTDDYSRESVIYLMKDKSDVPHYFQLYKKDKKLHSRKLIKALRCDGGTEYKKIEYGGIKKQTSALYTQHQNGVSESLNRTKITMARCLLFHAHLPLRFWDAAILTSCYLRNRLPINKNNLTPFEIMGGKPSKLYHLKVWGCVCYALIDDKDQLR